MARDCKKEWDLACPLGCPNHLTMAPIVASYESSTWQRREAAGGHRAHASLMELAVVPTPRRAAALESAVQSPAGVGSVMGLPF